MTNPCKDCPRHSADCHASCTDYAAWNALHQAAKDKDARRRAVDEFAIRNALRIKRKKAK